MERRSVAGIGSQNLAITRLGLAPAAGLMGLDGAGKQRRNVCCLAASAASFAVQGSPPRFQPSTGEGAGRSLTISQLPLK